MRKSYIFIYSDSFGTRDEVKRGLDEINIVLDWRFELPNSFYLVSEAGAEVIANEIRAKFGNKVFLVLEYTPNSQGWLDPESWYLLNNSRRKPS